MPDTFYVQVIRDALVVFAFHPRVTRVDIIAGTPPDDVTKLRFRFKGTTAQRYSLAYRQARALLRDHRLSDRDRLAIDNVRHMHQDHAAYDLDGDDRHSRSMIENAEDKLAYWRRELHSQMKRGYSREQIKRTRDEINRTEEALRYWRYTALLNRTNELKSAREAGRSIREDVLRSLKHDT